MAIEQLGCKVAKTISQKNEIILKTEERFSRKWASQRLLLNVQTCSTDLQKTFRAIFRILKYCFDSQIYSSKSASIFWKSKTNI